MPKNSFKFLALAFLGILVGCTALETTQPTVDPSSDYSTALEAHKQINSTMLDWYEDAIVVGIFTNDKVCEQTRWQMEETGTAACWYFEVSSPGNDKGVDVCLKMGEIVVGIDCIADFEKPMLTDQELPLAQMIDTDDLMDILHNCCLFKDYTLEEIRTTRYDSGVDRVIPPSWELVYASDHDDAIRKRVFVNAITGEILRNDFEP